MSERAMSAPAGALEAKNAQTKAFKKKGIMFAVASGMFYGLYTAFMTQGMDAGIWLNWYGGAVSVFATIYTLSALGAAVNDVCSAIWALIIAALKGKLGDFGRSIRTKPGAVMILAAVIGGPFASTCYVLGLQMGGSIIVPIAALNAAICAILGKVLFKQKLTGKMILGIVICFAAAVLIGSTAFADGFDFRDKAGNDNQLFPLGHSPVQNVLQGGELGRAYLLHGSGFVISEKAAGELGQPQ